MKKTFALKTMTADDLVNRAYDILHVAAALLAGATGFWSFDDKQRALGAAKALMVRS